MSCEICGRLTCAKSFHSLAAQEAFERETSQGSSSFKICNQCGGIDGNHASGCGGNTSKPPAPTVGETPLCDRLQHAFVAEGTSAFYVQLEKLKTMERASTAAQLELDRLKAEVAARYTIPEIRAWRQVSNGSITLDDPDHGIAAFIANQRKEKGT